MSNALPAPPETIPHVRGASYCIDHYELSDGSHRCTLQPMDRNPNRDVLWAGDGQSFAGAIVNLVVAFLRQQSEMTPEEADAAYDASPAEEISEEEVRRLVAEATRATGLR